MLHLALCLLCASTPSITSSTVAPTALAQEKSTRDRFVELHAAKDEKGCEELWRQHPYEVIYVIDEDLEGALAAWEKASGKPDPAVIAAHHERALWGARIASRASSHPIFLDYTSAFVSQNDAQKKNFRGGQKAHGEARAAMKAKNFAEAQTKAKLCVDLASPLGDWWGHAMGLSALGAAFAADGKHVEAIAPLGQAAMIYRDLQMPGDEYGAVRALANALVATGAKERAKAVLGRALELAGVVGDDKNKPALEAELAKLAQ